MQAQSLTIDPDDQYQPPRVRGRRWLVVEGDAAGEIVAFRGLCRFELWGLVQARNWPRAAVIEVNAAEAHRIACSPAARGGGLVIDQITIGEYARECGTTPRQARRYLETIVASGTGLVARRMRQRRDESGQMSRSATPPAGIAELLADALAVALGPNAAWMRELPRPWDAIAATAREVIAGG